MHVESQLDFHAIGRRVQVIRESAHLSREAFGDLIGAGGKHIRNVETAARHLTPELASNICNAFPAYDLDYLYRGKEVDKNDNLYIRINQLTDRQRNFALAMLQNIERQDMG